MSKVLQPANDFVLLIDLPRVTTLDGVVLPDNVKQQEMVFGRVVSVGPAVMPAYTRAGDTVCYGPYAGKTVPIDGIEFRMLKEGQIEAYLKDSEPAAYIIETPKSFWQRFLLMWRLYVRA